MLQMLQDRVFREKVKQSDVCEWLARQNYYRSLAPEIVPPPKGSELRCRTCKTVFAASEDVCRECGEQRCQTAATHAALTSSADGSKMVPGSSSTSSSSLQGSASLPEAFRRFAEPKELSHWAVQRLNMKRECEASVCEQRERDLRQKYRHEQNSIVEHKVTEQLHVCRERFNATSNPGYSLSE